MDVYLGDICLFAFNFVPTGFALCNGTKLPVSQYNALYSLIGNNYGGDSINFALPNLLQASPVTNMQYYIATEGIYPSRQ